MLLCMCCQFLDENPGDEDLEEALEENKGVLVRKRHRVKALKNSISDLKAYQPHIADTTTEEQSASIGGVRQGESFPGDGHTLDSSGRDLGVGGSEAHKLDNGSSADEGSSGTVGNAGDVSSMADLMSLEATPPPAATAVIAALATSTASTAATAVAQGNGHPEHRNGTRTAAREPLRSDSGDINSEGVLL